MIWKNSIKYFQNVSQDLEHFFKEKKRKEYSFFLFCYVTVAASGFIRLNPIIPAIRPSIGTATSFIVRTIM